MSQEHSPTDRRSQIEAAVRAIDARDFDALTETVHPDVQFRSVFATAEGDVWHGIDGFRRWGELGDSVFDDFTVRLTEYRDIDDERAVGSTYNSGTARASGLHVEMHPYFVVTWRDGLVWRWDGYTTRAEALAAVGLSE